MIRDRKKSKKRKTNKKRRKKIKERKTKEKGKNFRESTNKASLQNERGRRKGVQKMKREASRKI